ncbi:YpdA family putative bacillithiol disulfide reductase [Sediminitomix flava]|uniref:Thioredoxin reductase (NADPH) n=1 Tax=Sediminitomix flava TaxID=379075 RepID=A0A315ZB66_SEDFL|nr:YpdA family putative bacillithiol disulfide reductase [Sediminitomix flava]PWJ42600.1 thioredoxin reductase (NADPH)/hypothetical protein [Sediminitomix flava]
MTNCENMTLDVIIIGGGPIGMAAGIEAQKKGLNYLIIEKGCLVNSLFNYPANMTFFSTSEKLEIGGVPFISHNPRPTRREALEYYRRVQTKWNLNIHLFEEVNEVQKLGPEQFEVKTNKVEYFSKNIIVATGFYGLPNLMNIEGEDLPKVKHYYDDPHLYSFQKIVVVGAANSAIDAALETYRKGAEVTLVIREEEISQRVKYWVRPDIINRIKEGSIKAYFNSSLNSISEQNVIIETPEGSFEIENDFVLAMTGYKPDFSLLEKMGIILAEDELMTPSYNEDTHETNVEGIYLAGVICGGMQTNTWFIENSRVHAEIIIEEISRKVQ